MSWKIRERELALDRPRLMGILNITADSFSDGGRYLNPDNALRQAETLIREGADILDLGAESTRPGAKPVSMELECERLLSVLKILRREVSTPISIDTTKPETARACLQAGADIINDVSALKDSGPAMAACVCEYGAGLVLMHRRGNPGTMQTLAHYQNVVEEIMAELRTSLDLASAGGISRAQIVVDPGLGFAKTTEQNLEILRQIEEFQALGYPILLGPSRKSFMGPVTGRSVGEREFATAAVVAYGLVKDIKIWRVHNVAAMRDVVQMIHAIGDARGYPTSGGNYVGTFKMGEY